MNPSEAYVEFLEEQVHYYMYILEELFGPRDGRFTFVGVGRNSDERNFPQTYFPNGYRDTGCEVEIRIDPQWYDMQHRGMAGYQIAHECVHLLDPSMFGSAPMLEEGLAQWFQDEPEYHGHHAGIQARSASNGRQNNPNVPYMMARNLVRRCMPQLGPAIKEVRCSGTRLRNIKAEDLLPYLPDIDSRIIDGLCAPFPYSESLPGTQPLPLIR